MSLGFDAETLSPDTLDLLARQRRRAAADIVRLTSIAASGHPGGSLSSLDALLVLYACAGHRPAEPHWTGRDRIVVSHGHISPAVYSTLAIHGYFDASEMYAGFRRAGSRFGGHIETVVPGVEWNTGNLGQGLSAGCGFATAARVRGANWHVFVGMGDGEQQKGQVGEARRYAARYGLAKLIAWVDVNGLQIGGRTAEIMPVDLERGWAADGWNVLVVDGHDHQALYHAFRSAVRGEAGDPARPTVLLLRTVMGRGISAIENDHNYHGKPLTDAMAAVAFAELGEPDDLDALRASRKAPAPEAPHSARAPREARISTGTPRTYAADAKIDCRSAWGAALVDLDAANRDNPASDPIVGFSCDLEGSVKMDGFRKAAPNRFFECGIAEHNVAVIAGAASREGLVPFFSTFGMFGMVETYNQQRLNDQNGAAPRVVSTHCGLDVGEDGPTHQCIDYVALAQNLFGVELFVPADGNECDRIVRTVAARNVPAWVAMGRSVVPIVTDGNGEPLLGGTHRFEPGRWVELRPGSDATVFTYGAMVHRALRASDALRAEGFGLRVVNASSLKPIDRASICAAARETGKLLTYEDHNGNTGLGSLVAGVLADERLPAALRRLGAFRYGSSGKPDDVFAEQGLAPEQLMAAARAL